jgi:hypothetical protein
MKRLALVALLAVTTPALADDTDEAKKMYDEGKRYYTVGDYDHAITAWKAAYVKFPAPILLFNLGQAYRLEGDCAQAMTFYRRYEEQGKIASQQELDDAKGKCKDAKPPPPAVVEPKPFEKAPDPGEASAMRRPPPARRSSPMRTAGIVTGGAGVALLGVSTFFGLKARGDAHDVESGSGNWDATRGTQDSGKSAATTAVVTGVFGVAALGTGAVLYVLGKRAANVEVAAGPHGAQVAWHVHF